MYFNFTCSNCGKTLKVREELAGRKAKCPFCRAAISVPDQSITEGGVREEAESGAAGPDSTTITRDGTPLSGAAVGKPGVAAEAKAPLPQIAVGPKSGPPAIPTRPRTRPRPSAGRKKRSSSETEDGTSASMLWTSLVGLGGTVLFYLLLLPLPAMYFRDLFYARGWVTVAETLLMFWSVAILFFKWFKLRRQRESMLFDLLPENISREITVDNVEQFASTIRELPVDPNASFLVQRVLRGLEHFTVRRSASEVSTVLASQSELDSHAVGSSYALLNVFIWAIPILGFIGTVQGLGTAVGSLGVGDTTDIEGIKQSLGAITGGLGVAFDTTLVALMMSLMLKFPASSLQKAEEDLLNWVDEYCNENLLKRLKESGGEPLPEPTEVGKIIQRAVDQNLAEIVEQARKTVTLMNEQSQAAQRQLTQIVRDAADTAAGASLSLADHLQLLRQAVTNMNEVLGQLEGKQVVIQTAERPRRRWRWFGSRSEDTH